MKKAKLIIDWLLARLSENSTWRGMVLIAAALGAAIEPELANAIIGAGLAIVGLINLLRQGGTTMKEVDARIDERVEAIESPDGTDVPPKAIIVDESKL